MDPYVILWIVVLIASIVVEIATMGLTSIWFAGGALIALIVALIHGPFWLQIVLFVVVSLALLFITRPLATRYFNRYRQKTNAESLVGEKAVVKETIDNLNAVGHVSVNGNEWTARSERPEEIIPEGTTVVIRRIEGVKLIVAPVGKA
ncbi:MAG: NfeD family protein [Lachnospiraceae bacterium]|nr:NfeD family protein [Lachnospiraceae bacterium]